MAPSAAAAGIVDPTKAAKYPVILSDALLGKVPKEVYTGIRYNHKPTLSSETAPAVARLRPSAPSAREKGGFDLSFSHDGGRYAYTGSRNSKDNQYVLIFDPARRAFVLHRVDSVFNMNLAQTPTRTDAAGLRADYPQLGSNGKPETEAKKRAANKEASSGNGRVIKAAKESKARKSDKEKAKARDEEAAAAVSFMLPQADPEPIPAVKPKATKSAQSKRRAPSPEDSEDDDDDDGGLTVEYPEGAAPPRHNPVADFSPAFPAQIRRFSDFAKNAGEEEEDADAEFEDDLLEVDDSRVPSLQLPSPLNGSQAHGQEQDQGGNNGEDANEIDFGEDDLEAELEKEFQAGMDVDEESDISEED